MTLESMKPQQTPTIHVRDLMKEFVRPVELHGRFASMRRLFTRRKVTKVAVSGVSFDIEAYS